MWQSVVVALFLLQGAIARDADGPNREAQASPTIRNLPEEERLLDKAAEGLRGLGPRLAASGDAFVNDVVGVCQLYSSIGRQAKADSLFQSFLEMARREKAPVAVEALLAWKGRDSMRQGRFQEAAGELQEALAIGERERVRGLDGLLVDLSHALSRLGRAPEAEALLLRKGSLPQPTPPPSRPPSMCESPCGCYDLETPGQEPLSLGWLPGLFRTLMWRDMEEEALRFLVEESSGASIAERFRRLSDLQGFLRGYSQSQTRPAESDEVYKIKIAILLRSEPLDDLGRTLEGRCVGRLLLTADDDRIRKEIANSPRALGASGIEYVRNLDPRVEAAIEKADYAAAERVLDQLGGTAVETGDLPTKYLLFRSRRALVKACQRAAMFDAAKKLADRQVADALAWFGKETYYYASALSLLLDLAMQRKDYPAADALERELSRLGFGSMNWELYVQPEEWKAKSAWSPQSPK
jgi:hypothetical protein